MTTNFQGNFSATAIGSFPHTNAEVACEIMFKSLPEIPCWPQLPKISTKEEMCIQYTEGLPCIKIHEDGKTVSIDDTQDTSGGLERFYELFLKNDPDLFAISPECAAGFYTMLNKLKNQPSKAIRAVKGQVIGPITLAGSLKLSSGITALDSDEFFDIIIKLMSMKAYWQFTKLSQYGMPVINLMITSKNSSLYKAVIPDDSFRAPARVIGPITCPFTARMAFEGWFFNLLSMV